MSSAEISTALLNFCKSQKVPSDENLLSIYQKRNILTFLIIFKTFSYI